MPSESLDNHLRSILRGKVIQSTASEEKFVTAHSGKKLNMTTLQEVKNYLGNVGRFLPGIENCATDVENILKGSPTQGEHDKAVKYLHYYEPELMEFVRVN